MIPYERIQAQRNLYGRTLVVGDVAVKVLTEHNLRFGVPENTPVAEKTLVRIAPGFSFGDGTHPSTRQCLALLQEYLKPGMRVLDVGCGSGILGIAALRLGAEAVFAVDRDAGAVKTAMDNAERNGVSRRFTAWQGDLTQGVRGKFEMITANLLPEPLLRLLPLLPELLTGDGYAVLGGIRACQAHKIECAAGDIFQIVKKETEESWVSLALTRKENV